MIPSIGFIVGFYVMTRMLQVVVSETEKRIARVAAGVTLVLTALCVINLFISSTDGVIYDSANDPTLSIPRMNY